MALAQFDLFKVAGHEEVKIFDNLSLVILNNTPLNFFNTLQTNCLHFNGSGF